MQKNVGISLSSEVSRRALSKLIINLFHLWNLSIDDQLQLLGLSINRRAMLIKFGKGEPLPRTQDILDRVGWLLSIHKALRLLYPKNEEIRYSWVSRRNTIFNNLSPLRVMKEQGITGIVKVAHYLDYYLNEGVIMETDLKYLVKNCGLTLMQKRLFNALVKEPTAHVYSKEYMCRHHLNSGAVTRAMQRLILLNFVSKEDGIWQIQPPELRRYWEALGNISESEKLRFAVIEKYKFGIETITYK